MSDAIRRLLCLAALAVAAGCATRPLAPPPDQREAPLAAQERRAKASRPTYNLTGYPLAVREGYIDGCESAKQSEYARKDAKRIAVDPQYEMGWKDGFSICGLK
jgi:predicted small lipoprotein YifL